MKTFKVICFDEQNEVKYVDVNIKTSFEYFGYTWCVHRPVRGKKVTNTWTVSEYMTGMKCAPIRNTIDGAIRAAEKALEEAGEERTERAVKLAIEKRGVINDVE
jgi:hypothetical protein